MRIRSLVLASLLPLGGCAAVGPASRVFGPCPTRAVYTMDQYDQLLKSCQQSRQYDIFFPGRRFENAQSLQPTQHSNARVQSGQELREAAAKAKQ